MDLSLLKLVSTGEPAPLPDLPVDSGGFTTVPAVYTG